MINTLTLGFILGALQNAAPVDTPLGRPVTREPNPVVLVQRGAAVRLDVAAIWTDQEELEHTPILGVPPSQGRRASTTVVQYNSVRVSLIDLQAALTGIPALETPIETALPTDGRLMLVWDRITGEINAQMAASAAVAAEGETLPCPHVGDLMIGMVTKRASKAKAVLEGGEWVVTQLSPAGDPTTRLTSYSALIAATFEELLENTSPSQVALGYFDLQATGERVEDLPVYSCSLSTWQSEPGERNLCVAKSSDDLRWYIWFEGEMPQ